MTRRHVTVLLAAAAFVAAAVVPAGAQAGTFEVRACDADPNGANNAWTAVATQPTTFLTTFTSCPTGSTDPYGDLQEGVGVFDTLGGGNPPMDGKFAEQRFTAPAGTRITAATLFREIGNRDEYWVPYGRVDSTDQPADTCFRASGQAYCHLVGTRTLTGLNAQQLAYGARCQGVWTNCPTGATLHHVWVLIKSATVTLDDTQAPVVGDLTGTLADGAWHNAPGTLSFTATDNTGIRTRRLVEGATTRATMTAPLAAAGGCGTLNSGVAYTYTQPCAGTRGLNDAQTITADVCAWGDGDHTIRAGATDTGGLETLSAGSVTVRVDCTAPTVAVTPSTTQDVTAGTAISPTVTPTDARSGLSAQETEVQKDSGAWSAYTGPITTQAGRQYRFRARATDAAGNTSAWTTSATTFARAPSTGGGSSGGSGGGGGGGGGGSSPAPAQAPAASPSPVPATLVPAISTGTATPAALSITRARVVRRTGRLLIGGEAPGADGARVSITAGLRIRGRSRVVHARTRIRRGRYSLDIALPRGARGTVRITVKLVAAGWTSVARRAVRLPARRRST